MFVIEPPVGGQTAWLRTNVGCKSLEQFARIVKLDITKPREGLVLGASPSMGTMLTRCPFVKRMVEAGIVSFRP